MNTIGIIYNARVPEALDLSNAIVNELSLEKRSWISPAENLETLRERVPDTDLVITAGGDGTILRAASVTAPCGIPMVGVNMGRLGFMTELQVHEALERLPLYFEYDDSKGMSRLAAYLFAQGGEPIAQPFLTDLRTMTAQLAHGRRPLTLLLVAGPVDSEQLEEAEEVAAIWFTNAWRTYRDACRP